MAKPGPPRTPTNTLAARGSSLAKGRIDYDTEANLIERAPPPPKTLDADAKAHWKIMCKLLMYLDVLAQTDLVMLRRYCYQHSKYWALAETTGDEDKHFDRMMKLHDAMFKFEVQCGMTPSSRSSLPLKKTPKKAKNDAKTADFLKIGKTG